MIEIALGSPFGISDLYYTISHFKRRPLRVGIFECDLVTVTL